MRRLDLSSHVSGNKIGDVWGNLSKIDDSHDNDNSDVENKQKTTMSGTLQITFIWSIASIKIFSSAALT